jgi:hypothetical protein
MKNETWYVKRMTRAFFTKDLRGENDMTIGEAIQEALVEGQLPCAVAFKVAQRLGVEPVQVGGEATRLGVRLAKCQLGLFGYGSKAEGTYKRVKPMQNVPPELALAIRSVVGPDGKLPCAKAWEIASQLSLPKQTVSDAVEGLEVRIAPCQLGAF